MQNIGDMSGTRRKSRAGRIALYALLAIALLAAGLALWRSGLLETINSVEELQALIDRAGPYAWIVYFIVQMLTVILAPIPSNVSMMAGALALGFWPALVLGVGAVWLGSMLVFLAARRLGQRAVQKWVDSSVMEKYLPIVKDKQDMFLFLALLFPFFPDDVLCILAGVTTIPTGRFALLMLLARPWGLAFAALLGCGAMRLPVWGWALMLTALCAVFYFAMKYNKKIEDWLLGQMARIPKRRKP